MYRQQCLEQSRTNDRGLDGTRKTQGHSVQFLGYAKEAKLLGDRSGGGTPGPIPNPAVKPSSADGTSLATGWKSRSSPRGFASFVKIFMVDVQTPDTNASVRHFSFLFMVTSLVWILGLGAHVRHAEMIVEQMIPDAR